MAHRRNQAATSNPNNKKNPSMSMNPPISTSKQQHPIPCSILNKLKSHFPKKPNSTHLPISKPLDPPRVHSRLQPKSLTLSANADSFLVNKPHSCSISHHPQYKQTIIMDKHTPSSNNTKSKQNYQQGEEEEDLKPSSTSRRKSFGDAKIDLADFFFNLSARVVAVDMPPFMQIHAVSCARKTYDCLEKPSSKILASTLKKEFDRVYGPAWHCIVGTSFGSFVTHSVNRFFYFSLDHKMYILLFKTTVERAA